MPQQKNDAKQTEGDSANIQDAPQQVDVDFGTTVERLDSWVDNTVQSIPNVVLAALLLALFYGLAGIVGRYIYRRLSLQNRDNLGEVLSDFVRWAIIFCGFLVAATIVIPTVRPGDLFAGLGVGSVAIGFAFKDILQNWLAGLLILLRQPFDIGDQIAVNGHEGLVEKIENRATLIKTYDGQRIVIPNSNIYTNAVLVKTAFAQVREEYDVGIGYSDDLDKACEVIKEAVATVTDIDSAPPPEALVWDLAPSWVTIRVRWWTKSQRADVLDSRSEVIRAIKLALDDARIDMPFTTCVQLLHDQTEDSDRKRSTQREGWPPEKR